MKKRIPLLITLQLFSSTWQPVSDANWGTSANWSNGVPGISGEEFTPALFPALLGAPVVLGPPSPLDLSLLNISFYDSYTIEQYINTGQISSPIAPLFPPLSISVYTHST